MTFGTDGPGLASGAFIYDVWDPSGDSLAANHTTLPNTTSTDTFCSAQLMLSSGSLLIAGGDQLDGGIFGYATDGEAYSVSTTGAGTMTRHGTLPIQTPGNASSVALFAPGRALQCGGDERCAIVDFNGPFPRTEPAAPLSAIRMWHTATTLADGRVLVTGGSREWHNTELIGPSTTAERAAATSRPAST